MDTIYRNIFSIADSTSNIFIFCLTNRKKY